MLRERAIPKQRQGFIFNMYVLCVCIGRVFSGLCFEHTSAVQYVQGVRMALLFETIILQTQPF